MNIGVCTDIGRIRDNNQDSYYYFSEEDLQVYVVADGMGGHKAGEVASYIAVDTIEKLFIQNKSLLTKGKLDIQNFITNSVSEANKRIYEKAISEEKYNGMGTTITAAYIINNDLFIGHIGDSRAYLLRDEKMIQLTEDHSLVAQLVKNGTISKKEAQNHPQRNMITRALGTEKNIELDIEYRELEKNDILLLCTDGLTNLVDEDKIKHVLILNNDIQVACHTLVEMANELGGFDNITVLAVKIV
jgi:serine/threonine protein phosphatase PrpC